MNEVTRILSDLAKGEAHAAGQLLPLVYEELRKLAAARMAAEAPGNTLNATALVHEAYLRLVGPIDEARWDNRSHFFAAAAEAMRRILVEAARRKQREKHGGDLKRIDLDAAVSAAPDPRDDLVALDAALTRLEAEEPQAAKLVELRHFTGFRCGVGSGPGHLATHCRPGLGVRPGLVTPRTGQHGSRSGSVTIILA